MKLNKIPNASGIPDNGFYVRHGGTKDLVGVLTSSEGQPFGIAITTGDNKVNPANIDSSGLGYRPTLTGPKTGLLGQMLEYTITNFSDFRNYVATTDAGTVVVVGDKVHFTPNANGFKTFVLNGRSFEIEVGDVRVVTPSITGPASNTGLNYNFNVTSSAFATLNSNDAHESSDWELSLYNDFHTLVASSYNDVVNKTSWPVANLFALTVYYVRVRYKGNTLPSSAWSAPFSLQTKAAVDTNVKPTITSPAYGAQNQAKSLTIQSSAFSALGWTDTHVSSDWQLSTTIDFSSIAQQLNGSTTSKTSWAISGLTANTTYYVRSRYTGSMNGVSQWSLGSEFKTAVDASTVNKPSILLPANGYSDVGLSGYLVGSAFSWTGDVALSHKSSDWQVATDSGFTNLIVNSSGSGEGGSSAQKTKYAYSGLAYGTTYYARLRYRATDNTVSAWSNIVSFNTTVVYPPEILMDFGAMSFTNFDATATLRDNSGGRTIKNIVWNSPHFSSVSIAGNTLPDTLKSTLIKSNVYNWYGNNPVTVTVTLSDDSILERSFSYSIGPLPIIHPTVSVSSVVIEPSDAYPGRYKVTVAGSVSYPDPGQEKWGYDSSYIPQLHFVLHPTGYAQGGLSLTPSPTNGYVENFVHTTDDLGAVDPITDSIVGYLRYRLVGQTSSGPTFPIEYVEAGPSYF